MMFPILRFFRDNAIIFLNFSQLRSEKFIRVLTSKNDVSSKRSDSSKGIESASQAVLALQWRHSTAYGRLLLSLRLDDTSFLLVNTHIYFDHWCPRRVKELFDINTAMHKQCSIQTERVLHCKTMRRDAHILNNWLWPNNLSRNIQKNSKTE